MRNAVFDLCEYSKENNPQSDSSFLQERAALEKISLDDFELLKVVGVGGYGKV